MIVDCPKLHVVGSIDKIDSYRSNPVTTPFLSLGICASASAWLL